MAEPALLRDDVCRTAAKRGPRAAGSWHERACPLAASTLTERRLRVQYLYL
jgi:hypothetical protein